MRGHLANVSHTLAGAERLSHGGTLKSEEEEVGVPKTDEREDEAYS